MPTLRSQTLPSIPEPVLSEVLERLMGASGAEIRSEFLAIRKYYQDDVANVLGFFLGDNSVVWDPGHRKSHRYLVMWMIDFCGLKHPLIVTLLNKQPLSALERLEVVRYTKYTAEGGDPVHTYKHALGRKV